MFLHQEMWVQKRKCELIGQRSYHSIARQQIFEIQVPGFTFEIKLDTLQLLIVTFCTEHFPFYIDVAGSHGIFYL